MTTETKFLGVILVFTLILLSGGVFFLTRNQSAKEVAGVAILQIDYSKGEKIGSDSAKVKLVEFSDLECPACLVAEPYVKRIRSNYPDQLQFIYRHFPLPQHTHSRQVAMLAEAAAEQGKFWEMHDQLFETQSQWSPMSEKDANTFFLDLVNKLGLDEEKIKKALDDPDIKTKIDEDAAEGQRLGVNSTPTFFLDGRKLNLQNFSDLNTAVADKLKN